MQTNPKPNLKLEKAKVKAKLSQRLVKAELKPYIVIIIVSQSKNSPQLNDAC